MKIFHCHALFPRLLVFLLPWFVIAACPAQLVQEKAIVFEDQAFATSKTASKPWVINKIDEGPTEVWSATNARAGSGGGDARLCIARNMESESEIVWKIEVPPTYQVKEFTWGVASLFLSGATLSTAIFSWEYSGDGKEWTELVSLPNQKAEDGNPRHILNQVYSASGVTFTNTFYLRARNHEDTLSGAASYYAIFSTFPEGGESEHSFVSVTVEKK